MIDDQSEAGAWEAELARMGTHAPGASPPERCFLESFFRVRRSDPRFRLESGDIRLTRDEQAMLVRMMRTLQDAVTGTARAERRSEEAAPERRTGLACRDLDA
jgi:hypothetical protein